MRIETRQGRGILVAIALLLTLGGCATLPENTVRPTSHAYTDTDDTRLGRSRREEIRRHPDESGFLLLGNGLDAFVARAVLANAAERSIDAQYYLLHGDLTGRLFVDQLIKAANRGVCVRLLVDDMDLGGKDLGVAVLDSFSPYFVPGRAGTAFLSDLSRRGVRVRVVTNSLASIDVPVVHSGYAKYRKDLLRAGVELHEMKPKPKVRQKRRRLGLSGSSKATFHSKAFIFDRKHIFIGSLNFDPRSVHENTEIGVVLTSPVLAARSTTAIDEAIDRVAFRLALETDEHGNEKIFWHDAVNGERYSVDPQTGFWQRFGVGFMGLLPVESQL